MRRYYFTSFVRDVNTNEPITLFWTLNAQGFVKKNNLPFLSTLFRCAGAPNIVQGTSSHHHKVEILKACC
jgi:phosphatidate phosphatase APP1